MSLLLDLALEVKHGVFWRGSCLTIVSPAHTAGRQSLRQQLWLINTWPSSHQAPALPCPWSPSPPFQGAEALCFRPPAGDPSWRHTLRWDRHFSLCYIITCFSFKKNVSWVASALVVFFEGASVNLFKFQLRLFRGAFTVKIRHITALKQLRRGMHTVNAFSALSSENSPDQNESVCVLWRVQP